MDDSSTEQVDFEPPEERSDSTATNDVVDGHDDDREIEEMKIRLANLEEAAEKAKVAEEAEEKKRRAVAATSSLSRMSGISPASRSVYVGNVDFSTTAEELAHYFEVRVCRCCVATSSASVTDCTYPTHLPRLTHCMRHRHAEPSID